MDGCVGAGMGGCCHRAGLHSVEKGKETRQEGWGLGNGPGSGLVQGATRSSREDVGHELVNLVIAFRAVQHGVGIQPQS